MMCPVFSIQVLSLLFYLHKTFSRRIGWPKTQAILDIPIVFLLLVVLCHFYFFKHLLFKLKGLQIKLNGYYFHVLLSSMLHICFPSPPPYNWLSDKISINLQSRGSHSSREKRPSPSSLSAGHVLALTFVQLVLPMIMALAGSSVAHGSEKRKGILNYREKWCLKRQQFTDVCFFSFFHSKIFSYSLFLISIKYGLLHFLRNFIIVSLGEIIQEDSTKRILYIHSFLH